MRFFKKLKYGLCKLCGEISEPLEIRGENFYNTSTCHCSGARDIATNRLNELEARRKEWMDRQPKSQEELQTEALQRIAAALEKK